MPPPFAENVYYDLHQQWDEPNTFFIIRGWSSQAAIDAHAGNAHVAQVMKKLGPLLTLGPSFRFTNRVGN